MTTAAPSPDGWSTRRWAMVVALIFAAHAGLIVLLEEHTAPAPRPRDTGLTVAMVLDPATGRRLLDALAVSDPTLLPLGNARTGPPPAWKSFSPSEQRLQEAVASAPVLAQPAAGLGTVFGAFVRTNTVSSAPVPDRPAALASLPTPPATASAGKSTLRIQGELALRPLVAPMQPRSWPHTNLLASSVVQVLVNSAGEVLSPRLATGGGSPDTVQRMADQQALELARSLRFEPRAATGAGFTAGTLVFQWHVTAPPATTVRPSTP